MPCLVLQRDLKTPPVNDNDAETNNDGCLHDDNDDDGDNDGDNDGVVEGDDDGGDDGDDDGHDDDDGVIVKLIEIAQPRPS